MMRRRRTDEDGRRRQPADHRDFNTYFEHNERETTMKNTFKKMIASVLMLVLAFCLVSCGSSQEESTGPKTGTNSTYAYLLDTTNMEKPELDLSGATGVLKKILDSGVFTIGTSPDYPAAEFVTEDGTVLGSEMMLAKYIANWTVFASVSVRNARIFVPTRTIFTKSSLNALRSASRSA